jgi:hypothetical protein
MKIPITTARRAHLAQALDVFLEAMRVHIVQMLSSKFGEQWPDHYKSNLSPEHQIIWINAREEGRVPEELIDYPHLSLAAQRFKDLWWTYFQKESYQLSTRFSQIYAIRNKANHYEKVMDSDDYQSFWINTRAIAKGIKNQELLDSLNELEKAAKSDEATEIGSEKNSLGVENAYSTVPEAKTPLPNASYFLPILIRGQRFHAVHLCAQGVVSNAFVREFIFEQNADQILLFNLIEGAYQGRTTADRHQTCQIVEVTLAKDCLVVMLDTVAQLENLTVPTTEHCRVQYDAQRKEQRVSVDKKQTFQKIVFRLRRDSQVYEGAIQTSFAPASQISDIALDFGSEASQAVEQSRNAHGLHRTKLLKLTHEYFYPKLEAPFHQEDPDDELFRSQVFVRKNEVVMQLDASPNQNQGYDIIQTLTSDKDTEIPKNTYALIPNPKLAHLGVYNFRVVYKSPDDNPYQAQESLFSRIVPDVQQMVIHHILHTLLRSVHRQKGGQHPLYISIKFLVPNVLEQALVTRLINQAYTFLRQPNIAQMYRIGGVEVSTLSESDAAFLGHWTTPGVPQKSANYLIVDVGKGTTDFSIIRSHDDFSLSSDYRAGFIGAGNLITYAFIETILTAFLGGEDSTRKERRKLLKIIASSQTDIATKYEFLRLVEQIKRNFHPFSKTNKPMGELVESKFIEDFRKIVQGENAHSTLLQEINKLLKAVLELDGKMVLGKPNSIMDDFGFINNAVKKLVKRLKQQVMVSDVEAVGTKLEKLQKIVLTGRGFLFQMLVDELQQAFGPDEKGRDRIVIQPHTANQRNELKKICLSGAFSGRTINYDANLVGTPHLHTLMSNDKSEPFIQVSKGADAPKTSFKTDKWGEQIFSWLKDDQVNDDTPPITPPKVPSTPPTMLPLLQFLIRGLQFDEPYNPNIHSIHISGVKYLGGELPAGEPIDLMFDGEQFWLRTSNGLRAIVYPREFMHNDEMVWPTLFPFFDAAAEYHTPIDGTLITD